jgi:hypothetical protein
MFCAPAPAAWSAINGRIVVREGRLATIDLPIVLEQHNRLARVLAEG